MALDNYDRKIEELKKLSGGVDLDDPVAYHKYQKRVTAQTRAALDSAIAAARGAENDKTRKLGQALRLERSIIDLMQKVLLAKNLRAASSDKIIAGMEKVIYQLEVLCKRAGIDLGEIERQPTIN